MNFFSLKPDRLFSAIFLVACLGLWVYSYSQVDLNLTLSAQPDYQVFQSYLTQLGYFQRYLSTLIYIVILILLFLSYFGLIYLAKFNKLQFSIIIKLVLTISFVLFLAYPALSYDIFNYIFDVRILILHGANPWTHTALDFPNDLWTRFMHWTHRTYPYGPSWLLLTLPFYLLGLGKFVLTLFNFKLLGVLSYLLAVYSLHRIILLKKLSSPNFRLAVFAFNPLIVIESLVNAHIDIAMAALMLYGMYLYLANYRTWGFLTLIFSGLIKYVSLAVLPFLILFEYGKISFSKLINLSLVISYLLTLVVVSQREVLAWYFITPFALTVLSTQPKAFRLMQIIGPAALVRYIPYLYQGYYSDWVIQSRNYLSLGVLMISLLILWINPRKLGRLFA